MEMEEKDEGKGEMGNGNEMEMNKIKSNVTASRYLTVRNLETYRACTAREHLLSTRQMYVPGEVSAEVRGQDRGRR